MKLRRREMDRLVSAEKREAQLLQRQTNSRELKRNVISATTAFHVQDHPAASVQGCCSTSQNPHQMDFSTILAAKGYF